MKYLPLLLLLLLAACGTIQDAQDGPGRINQTNVDECLQSALLADGTYGTEWEDCSTADLTSGDYPGLPPTPSPTPVYEFVAQSNAEGSGYDLFWREPPEATFEGDDDILDVLLRQQGTAGNLYRDGDVLAWRIDTLIRRFVDFPDSPGAIPLDQQYLISNGGSLAWSADAPDGSIEGESLNTAVDCAVGQSLTYAAGQLGCADVGALEDGAVVTAKIADGAVTAAKTGFPYIVDVGSSSWGASSSTQDASSPIYRLPVVDSGGVTTTYGININETETLSLSNVTTTAQNGTLTIPGSVPVNSVLIFYVLGSGESVGTMTLACTNASDIG
ncbi:MAG: hypothetical protein F4Y04_05740, partial [Chloroflexi bacterium]|nr:hypothetical protein [Chloroflexota bacterium]